LHLRSHVLLPRQFLPEAAALAESVPPGCLVALTRTLGHDRVHSGGAAGREQAGDERDEREDQHRCDKGGGIGRRRAEQEARQEAGQEERCDETDTGSEGDESPPRPTGSMDVSTALPPRGRSASWDSRSEAREPLSLRGVRPTGKGRAVELPAGGRARVGYDTKVHPRLQIGEAFLVRELVPHLVEMSGTGQRRMVLSHPADASQRPSVENAIEDTMPL
jgi:hypothetical protein